MGGSLWEQTTKLRAEGLKQLSSVTADVASAMKEELVGVSSSAEGAVKGVSNVLTNITLETQDGWSDGELELDDEDWGGGGEGWEQGQGGQEGEGDGASKFPQLLSSSAPQDSAPEGGSSSQMEEVAFQEVGLDSPGYLQEQEFGGQGAEFAAGGAEGADVPENGAAKGLLGQVNIGNIGTAAGTAAALIGSVRQLPVSQKVEGLTGKVWEQTSSVRSKLSSVTKEVAKEVASAVKDEVQGVSTILSSITQDDEYDDEDEAEGEGRPSQRKNQLAALSQHFEVGEGNEGMEAISAMEGISMEVEGLELEREMLRAQMKELESENEKLKQDLAAERANGSSFHQASGMQDQAASKELEQTLRENSDLKESLQGHQKRIGELQEGLEAQSKDVQRLQQQLLLAEKSEEEIQRLLKEEKLKSKQAEQQAANSIEAAQNASKQLDLLQGQVTVLEEQKAMLEAEKSGLESRIAASQDGESTALQEVSAQLAAAVLEKKELSENLSALEKEFDKLKDVLAEVESQKEALLKSSEASTQLNAELKQLQLDHEELMNANDELTRKLDESKSEHQASLLQCKGTEKELSEVSINLVAVEARLADAEVSNSELQSKMAALASNLEVLQQQNSVLQKSTAQSGSGLEQAEETIRDLQQQLQNEKSNAKAAMEEVQQGRAALEAELHSSSATLAATEAAKASLGEKLQAALQEQMGLVQRAEQAEKERMVLEGRMAAVVEGEGVAMQELRDELAAQEETNTRLQQKIRQTEDELVETKGLLEQGKSKEMSRAEAWEEKTSSSIALLKEVIELCAKKDLSDKNSLVGALAQIQVAVSSLESQKENDTDKNVTSNGNAKAEELDGITAHLKLEQEVARSKAELELVQDELSRSVSALHNAKKEKTDLEGKLREMSSMKEAAEAARAELGSKLEAALKEQMSLLERAAEADREKQALESRMTAMQDGEGAALKELTTQLDAATAAKSEADSRVDQLQGELNSQAAQNECTAQSLKEKDAMLEHLTAERDALSAEFKALRSDQERFQTELEVKESTVVELDESLLCAKQECENLREQVLKLSESCEQLEAEKLLLEETAAMSGSGIAEAQIQIKDLQGKMEGFQQEASKLTGELDAAKQEYKELESQMSIVAAAKEASEVALQAAEEAKTMLGEKLQESLKEQMVLVAQVEQGEKDRVALEGRIGAMQEGEGAAVQELTAQLEAAEKALSESRQMASNQDQAISEASADLEQAKQEKVDLESKLSQITTNFESARQETADLQSELKSTSATLETVQQEKNALQSKLSEASAALNAAETATTALGEKLQLSLREQMALVEQAEQEKGDKAALEGRIEAMQAGEGAATQELTLQLEAAQQSLSEQKQQSVELSEKLERAAAALKAAEAAKRSLGEQLQASLIEQQSLLERMANAEQGQGETAQQLKESIQLSETKRVEAEQQLTRRAQELEEALASKVELEKELHNQGSSSAAVNEKISNLVQLLAVSPEGDKATRLNSVLQRVQQAQTELANHKQKVSLLESWRKEQLALQTGHEEEIQRLQVELQQASQHLGKKEAEVMQANQKAEDEFRGAVQRQVDTLCRLLKVDSSADLPDRLGLVASKVQEAEQQSERLIEKIQQLESWRAEHVSGQEDSQILNAQLREVQGALEAKHSEVQKARAEGQQEVAAIKSELSKVEKQRERLQAELDGARAELQEVEDVHAVLQKKHDAAKTEKEQLLGELEQERRHSEEVMEEATQRAEAQFHQEVQVLRDALGKLKMQVAQTSEDNEARSEEVLLLEEDLSRAREEKQEIEASLQQKISQLEGELLNHRNDLDSLNLRCQELLLERDKAVEDKTRIEMILEQFHEQESSQSSFEVEKMRKTMNQLEGEAKAKDAQILEMMQSLAGFQKLQSEFEQCKMDLVAANTSRDDLSARVDHLSAELRKARMFAASEEFYIDRRLVSNIIISYFDGQKAGSEEILKLACSILGMDASQQKKVEQGARRTKQGGGMGLYGLLSAPAAGWETITEAEIGNDWVQFLLEEADRAGEGQKAPGV